MDIKQISKIALENVLDNYWGFLDGLLLDLGCGQSPYHKKTLKHVNEQIGLDLHKDNGVDVVADAHNLPFKSETFDSVFCSQVIEHVEYPEHVVDEIGRIIKVGGKLILSAPFMFPKHSDPFDYHRFTDIKLERMLKKAGFDVTIQRKNLGAFGVLALFMAYILPLTILIKSLIYPMLWIDKRKRDKNDAFACDWIFLAQKNKFRKTDSF